MSALNFNMERVISLRNILKETSLIQDGHKDASLVVIHNSETGNIVAFERLEGEDGLICGGVESGEGLIDAAIREAKEESGLTLEEEDVIYLFSMASDSTMVHCYYYDVASESDPVVSIGEEFSSEGRPVWVNPETFLAESSDKFKEFNNVLLTTLGFA